MLHKVLYSKLFPPPKFLEMPSVSLEVSAKGVSYFTAKSTEKGLLPDQHGFINLPEGVIVRNKIIKKEFVVKALTEIREKTGVSFVRFSIPEEETYIFKTHLPILT